MSRDGTTTVDDFTFDGATQSLGIGSLIAFKYQLEQKLGQGGMGAVFRAEHLSLKIPVAIKFLHPRLAHDPDLQRRFAHEAKALTVLDHPNVVRVLDYGVHDQSPFIVMEFLAGESLEDWLALNGLPTLAEVRDICLPVLDALGAAHDAGIVHRDVKPDNVFLARGRGGTRTVKLVDFGLAHVEDPADNGPTLTQTDAVAGTSTYMSPEQCRSLVVGPASDLYSFGCVLTKMLQGTPPFDGTSPAEVMTRQMFAPPPALLRPPGAEPVPPALDGLRLDLLKKDATARPQSARRVAEMLRDALDPSSETSRLATRKGDEPLGSREERAAQYGVEAPVPAPPVTARDRQFNVYLVKLAQAEGGIGAEAETALAVQGILLTSEGPEAQRPVILVDAGTLLSRALEYLERAGTARPNARVVVCVDGLDTEKMNQLVAAGAADVLRYPVNAGMLAKKLDRILRRRR